MSSADLPIHPFKTLCCCHCGDFLRVPVYCKNRFCPVCSPRRSVKIRRRLAFIISRVKPAPDASLKMLTLTIPNQKDARAGVAHLLAAFRKLRNRAFWRNHVDGGAWVVEIKGRPGRWHPHLHILLHCTYMPQRALVRLWRKCSGGRGVWISDIETGKGVGYLTKYVTKSDAPPMLIEQLNDALRDARLFQPFGSWHHVRQAKSDYKMNCDKCGHSSWLPLEMMSAQSRKFFDGTFEPIHAPPIPDLVIPF